MVYKGFLLLYVAYKNALEVHYSQSKVISGFVARLLYYVHLLYRRNFLHSVVDGHHNWYASNTLRFKRTQLLKFERSTSALKPFHLLGDLFGIPATVQGMTFVAAGGSLPESISIAIMSRRGNFYYDTLCTTEEYKSKTRLHLMREDFRHSLLI